MESLEAFDNLDDNFPDVFLFHELLKVLALTDALKHITIISKLHHNTITYIIHYTTRNHTSQSLTIMSLMAHQRMPPCKLPRMVSWHLPKSWPHSRRFLSPCLTSSESLPFWGHRSNRPLLSSPCIRLNMIHHLCKQHHTLTICNHFEPVRLVWLSRQPQNTRPNCLHFCIEF